MPSSPPPSVLSAAPDPASNRRTWIIMDGMSRRQRKVVMRLLGALLFSYFLCACGGGEKDAPSLVALHPSPSAFTFAVDDRFEVRALAEDEAGRRVEVEVEWATSAPEIVEVEGAGTAVGRAPGEATLTARHGGLRAEIAVRVVRRVDEVRIVPAELRILPGDSLELQLVVRDPAGAVLSRSAAWSSSDDAVARVDEEGVLYGEKVGEVEIRAEVEGIVGSAQVVVEPLPAHHVEILAPRTRLEVGETIELRAIVRNREGDEIEDAPVVWKSASPLAISVDEEGRVTVLRPADAEILAISGEAEGRIRLEGRIRYQKLLKLTDSAGNDPTYCGLDPEGIAFCHGDNSLGQLGDGSRRSTGLPIRVKDAPPFVDLVAPRAQTKGTVSWRTFHGITADGRVFRWGEEAPEGNWLDLDHAVVARIDRPWKDGRWVGKTKNGPAEGWAYCDLTDRGAALCHFGQAVREGPSLESRPDPEAQYARIVQISAARPFCWRYENGEVSCWSMTEEEASCWMGEHPEDPPVCGRLPFRGMGVPIPLPEPAVDLAAAGHSTCALLQSGALHCWQHVYELLSDGLIHKYWRFRGISAPQPAQVPAPISRLVSDYERICGIAEERVFCWDLAITTHGDLHDFGWIGDPYELDTGGLRVSDLELYSGLVRDAEGHFWELGEPPTPIPAQP